jgi:hypothetical protein
MAARGVRTRLSRLLQLMVKNQQLVERSEDPRLVLATRILRVQEYPVSFA